MSIGSLHSKEHCVEYDQLRKAMSLQQKYLDSNEKSHQFDPHKYFGGWEPIERKSIE